MSMDLLAGAIQNGIVVIVVILILAGIGIWCIDQLDHKKKSEERVKEICQFVEKDQQNILEIRNLLLGKKEACEQERKKVKDNYSKSFDLLNEVGFRHMGSYVSAHIGKDRYEKLLKDKECYIRYEEQLNQRIEQYQHLYTSFEEFIEREQKELPASLFEIEADQIRMQVEEIDVVIKRITEGIDAVKQSISQLSVLRWEGSVEVLDEKEIVSLKRLVEAGNVSFPCIIYAVLQEKGKPDTRIWANHLPYDVETGESLSGCFDVDEMTIDDMSRLSDRLYGGSTGLSIAACSGMAGLLFSNQPFTIRFFNLDDDEEVIKNVTEYPLAQGCQYTVECQFAEREWSLKLKA